MSDETNVPFEDFVGPKWHLYGADQNRFFLRESGRPSVPAMNLVVPREPVALVSCRHVDRVPDNSNAQDLLEFFDHDGHVWLTVGTWDSDDYYPCFVFTFSPKARP